MADYARWLGNPTRSEFKVALREVIEGEKVFQDAWLRHVSRDRQDRNRPGRNDAEQGFSRSPGNAHQERNRH